MTWSFQDTLNSVWPDMPACLASDPAKAAALAVLERLPDAFSTGFFEVRLRDAGGPVDFGFCIEGPARNGAWRAVGDQVGPVPPWWRPVRELVGKWSGGSSGNFVRLPLLWVEFDSRDPVPERTRGPGIILCLDPHFGNRDRNALNRPGPELLREAWAVMDGCGALPPGNDKLWGNVAACLGALPPEGRLLHLSVMAARRPPEVKLNFTLPKERLLPFLSEIRHPCRDGFLEPVLHGVFASLDLMKFDVYFRENLHAKIGLEAYPHNAGAAGCLEVLAALEKNGFCGKNRADALRSWPGLTRAVYPGHAWPTPIQRWFGLKLTCEPSRGSEAKGYLGFMPSFSLAA